jgi:hypothetical protein
VGRGKLEDVLVRAMQVDADVLIFDPELTPGQAHAIADFTDLKVLDRTMLILDIFAQRARSRDGKLQVELAQLRYRLPRLHEKNTMMSRLVGGIGGRGPGETKLEINRRRARERIHRLEQEIERYGRQRPSGARSARGGACPWWPSSATPTPASPPAQHLTASDVLAEDKLFATLDPTTRRLRFPREREVVVADTVGFIRDLPQDLAQAFRATWRSCGGRSAASPGRRRRSGSRAADRGGGAHPQGSGPGREPAPGRLQQGRSARRRRAGAHARRARHHRYLRQRSPDHRAPANRRAGRALARGTRACERRRGRRIRYFTGRARMRTLPPSTATSSSTREQPFSLRMRGISLLSFARS